MSVLLIALTILLIAAVYWRVSSRARSAIRGWADDYGYHVVSTRFHSAFSSEYGEAGREADVVYQVVLTSPAGDRHVAYFLIGNLMLGRTRVVVRWGEPGRDTESTEGHV